MSERTWTQFKAYYVAELEAERDALRGAMKAQDERERLAGKKCGVSAIIHGCDWPDAVAERVLALEAERDALQHELEVALRPYPKEKAK